MEIIKRQIISSEKDRMILVPFNLVSENLFTSNYVFKVLYNEDNDLKELILARMIDDKKGIKKDLEEELCDNYLEKIGENEIPLFLDYRISAIKIAEDLEDIVYNSIINIFHKKGFSSELFKTIQMQLHVYFADVVSKVYERKII